MTVAHGADTRWTAADVPDQRGRTAVVTGANSGIGFETAKVLAARGARVLLACRDERKAAEAVAAIVAAAPAAEVEVVPLDLGSLRSVREAAEKIRSAVHRIDLLVNNAGLMWPPRGATRYGFELQFGINHLGHFAFTGLLLDRILDVPGSRVVTVSSLGHRQGGIYFDDFNFERRGYRRVPAYGQSKLANLMFSYHLQRLLAQAESPAVSVAAHPGGVPTPLDRHVPFPARLVLKAGLVFVGQKDAATGALPTLRAATDPRARGGEYYGPDGRGETKGYPKLVESSPASHDEDAQLRLWQESERLTGVAFRF
jgi:NAD(P)-dependent dehydrogenase (short-subunit alcohol dehydrogenase family)